ncbi:MAG: pyridoxamine 5'-phosphate oxidase family protein [Betaproteobacteria bacterium]
MSDSTKLVTDYLDSLRPSKGGRSVPRAELLTEDAIFQTLGKLDGRNAVIERMSNDGLGAVYRTMQWEAPAMDGADVRITGRMPAGGGVIITFRIKDDRISAVLQQPLPGAPVPATPIKITAEIREMVKNAQTDGFPMAVAHVDPSGQPIISFRGSTQVFSDTQLAIWVRNSDGNFLNSVKANPKLALMYRNGKTRALYQFQGRARISTDEAAREQIFSNMNQSERNHDYARTGIALIIDLERIEGWAGMSPDGQVGKVRMLRDAG